MITINSVTVTDSGVLRLDISLTAPQAEYYIKTFWVTCGESPLYADYLVPRKNYYTGGVLNLPSGRRISYIPLSQWPNGPLTFTVHTDYKNSSNAVLTDTPVDVQVVDNTFFQPLQDYQPSSFIEGIIQKPVTLVFDIPPLNASKTIPVSISAEDNNAVTGYLITETNTVPSVTDPSWSALPPDYYTVSGNTSTVTLYAWAKDADGNISAPVSATVELPPPPYATPSGGRYQTAQTITLTDPAGGTIYYTMDGSDPRDYIPTEGGKAIFDNGSIITTGDVR